MRRLFMATAAITLAPICFAADACPLWSDIKKELPDTVHWQTLGRKAALAAEVMYAMAPGTPTELPDGNVVYLGTVEGKDHAIVIFSKDDYEVCTSPMRLEKDGLKIINELEYGAGGDL